ncbi:MAG TPA: DUF63 family protein [Methanomicrobia archaeon]|nr:DUF63 family protein [Methanomicrobia archaeon]
MIDALREFITTYYIHPITHDTGYNIVNTVTWALVLVAFLFLTLKLLQGLKIQIDRRFIAAVVPYIVVGATLRVIEDAELVRPPLSYLLITPLIFFLVFGCCVTLLVLAVQITKARRVVAVHYTHVFGLFGLLWCLANLALLIVFANIAVPWVPIAVIGIAGALTGAISALASKGNRRFLTDRLNLAVLAAHLLDAASSFIGIDLLGYVGKHVIEGLLVEHTGTAAGMFLLKLGILVPILYVLDTQFTADDEAELRNLVLLALLMIGLAPAVRNTLRMMLGV